MKIVLLCNWIQDWIWERSNISLKLKYTKNKIVYQPVKGLGARPVDQTTNPVWMTSPDLSLTNPSPTSTTKSFKSRKFFLCLILRSAKSRSFWSNDGRMDCPSTVMCHMKEYEEQWSEVETTNRDFKTTRKTWFPLTHSGCTVSVKNSCQLQNNQWRNHQQARSDDLTACITACINELTRSFSRKYNVQKTVVK